MKRRPSPKTQMVIALRAAARNIAIPAMRKAFAADADRIARTLPERYKRGIEGKIMPMARGLLRALPFEKPEALAGCAQRMRELADMLDDPGAEISYVELGRRGAPRHTRSQARNPARV
jgi:hypothetical protein